MRMKRMLRNLLRKLRLKSVQAGEGQREIDNVDAMSSMAQTRVDPSGGAPATFPPNYVRPTDEGRPRH
jgi:hypothetical protein